jgi:hypothetical protein
MPEIDEMSDETRERYALALACGDFVEALLEIGPGAGPWDNDPFEHCANTVEPMQGLAIDVLREHGFEALRDESLK